MSPTSPMSQSNMFRIPGPAGDYSSTPEMAEFATEFERLTQADEQLRHISKEVPGSLYEHAEPEIVDGTPLLGKLDEQQSVQQASAAVHEQIEMTTVERNRQIRDLEAMLNVADRIEILRNESDVVS